MEEIDRVDAERQAAFNGKKSVSMKGVLASQLGDKENSNPNTDFTNIQTPKRLNLF
jgi:hypothetical protein